MEKATTVLRFVAALFIAMSAGLRLAQSIRESVAAAKAEIAEEDLAEDAVTKLTNLMEKAATQAERGQH